MRKDRLSKTRTMKAQDQRLLKVIELAKKRTAAQPKPVQSLGNQLKPGFLCKGPFAKEVSQSVQPKKKKPLKKIAEEENDKLNESDIFENVKEEVVILDVKVLNEKNHRCIRQK